MNAHTKQNELKADITIDYNSDNGFDIIIKNHTQEKICAAISTLINTLVQNLEVHFEMGNLKKYIPILKEGYARIRYNAKAEADYTITCISDAIFMGFYMLNRDYPQYVNLSGSFIEDFTKSAKHKETQENNDT